MERGFGSRGRRGVKGQRRAGGSSRGQSILYPVRLPISRPINLSIWTLASSSWGRGSAQQLQGAALLSVSARRCV